MNCGRGNSLLKCPDTSCGTYLDEVIYSKKLSKTVVPAHVIVYVLAAILGLFLLVSFFAMA